MIPYIGKIANVLILSEQQNNRWLNTTAYDILHLNFAAIRIYVTICSNRFEALTKQKVRPSQEILQKALQGFESNYSEILNGTEKNMMFFPNAFNFDSRIGPTETSVPDS